MHKIFAFLTAFAAAAGLQLGLGLAGEDVFVVPRVPVQAQADSASAAKSVAQTEGRRRAMDILLRRLTIEEDWTHLPRLSAPEPVSGGEDEEGVVVEEPATTPAFDPYAAARAIEDGPKQRISLTDRDLEGLESSFEVYDERSSATTYRAFITYRFKPDAVRRLLKNAHIPYSETQTRTALVLPVLQTDNGVYLWESNNPWMAAWKTRPLNNELTPMAAPLGDLEDARIVTARQALDLDAERLAALAEHYSVSQVIVAHARLRRQNGEDRIAVRLINGYRETARLDADPELEAEFEDFGQMTPPPPQQRTANAAPEDDFSARQGDVLAQAALAAPSGNFPALAEQAIESIIAKYAGGWKARTLIDHSSEQVLETTAFFSSIADWTKIRAGLVATPLVGSVQVFALSPQGAEMRLRVFGDPGRLTVAMEAYGVVFWTEDNERWFLADPSLANRLRGSRALTTRRGQSVGGGPAPRLDPASDYGGLEGRAGPGGRP